MQLKHALYGLIVAALLSVSSAFGSTYTVTASAGSLAGKNLIYTCAQCSNASVPTLSSCGTSPTLSTDASDLSGTITLGSGATGCTLNLTGSYSSSPDVIFYSPDDIAFTTAAPSVVSSTTTFDPSNTNTTEGALSGGNLTYTSTGTGSDWGIARGVASHTTGKYYRECTVGYTFSGANLTGILNSSQSLANGQFTGSGANSIGWYQNGSVYAGGSVLTTIATFASGNLLEEADDIGAGLSWWRVHGGNWNNSGSANPATGTGGITTSVTGTVYPGVSLYGNNSGLNFTCNFGGSAYTDTPPSGFGNW